MYIGVYLVKPVVIQGKYPEINDQDIKKYKIRTLEEAIKIGEFFEKYINKDCATMTAPFELDIIFPDQCKILQNWIDNNQELIITNDLKEYFDVIHEYCTTAIELETGIEIEV